MIWPFLFALLFVIFAWRDTYKMSCGFMDYFTDTFLLALFTAVVFCVGIGFALFIGLAMPKQWSGPETTKLVNLRDNDSINDRFFLGFGSINATQYYFFYEEIGSGYKPGKVAAADNVTVFEEKQEGGELKTYSYQFVSPSFRWIALKRQHQKYEFFVPEGSIKKDFVLQ